VKNLALVPGGALSTPKCGTHGCEFCVPCLVINLAAVPICGGNEAFVVVTPAGVIEKTSRFKKSVGGGKKR